jgi:hypothetical protein
MKTFKNQIAQGDVLFRRVKQIPKEATPAVGDHAIVAHSETGHHHSFDAGASVHLYSTTDQLVSYLKVDAPAVLKHRRPFDTHEEIEFKSGLYEIRKQREWTPEGFRKVED